MEQFYDVPVQSIMRDAVRRAGAALEGMKIPVEPFRPPGLERAPNLWWFFFGRLPAGVGQKKVARRVQEVHLTSAEFLHAALQEGQCTAPHGPAYPIALSL